MKITEFIRNCPQCLSTIYYKTNNYYLRAIKINTLCKSCSVKNRYSNQEFRQKMSDMFKGDKNPFFNKKHSQKTIDIIKEKNRILSSGKNNFMYGKTVYNIWLEKYGKEIADNKKENFSKKISKSTSGEKNPMYGKPSPIGSGNGWSGWYKGWYFRSLLELSYMINIIERFKIPWKSAETSDLKIKYEYENINRTYVADFLLSNKYLIECKPHSLKKSRQVLIKQQAAIEFCKLHGYIYKIITPRKLTIIEIKELHDSDNIKFLPRYEEKFNKLIKT